MAELDPVPIQCELTLGIAAELAAAGFDNAREVGFGGFGFSARSPSTLLRTPQR